MDTTGLADPRLAALLATATDHAFVTYGPDGIIAGWSPGATELTGYSAADAIGATHGLLHSRRDVLAGVPDAELATAVETGSWQGRGWRHRHDGSRFWAGISLWALYEGDTLTGYANILRDHSAERASEEAARLAHEQMRYAFDAAPSGVAILSLDGRWLRVNDALCRITGWSRAELLTSTLQRLLEADDPAAGLASVQDLALGTDIATATETRIVRRDGVPIWVSLRLGTVRDENGHALHLVAQIEDISARVVATEAQDQALTEAAEAHRALLAAEAAKASFVAVASHELRTPLAAIKGYGALLARRWDDLSDARKRDAAATIERQAKRLQLLVEDLLTLSSQATVGVLLERRAVRVSELLDEVEEVVGETIHRSGDESVSIDADPIRISQLLVNLLVNAVKYGEPPYVVEVETIPARPAGEGREGQADRVLLRVRDHGTGVPEEFVPRLFDQYSQADTGLRRRSRGVGLGLAICKALADAHDADLTYRTHPSGGACFTLQIARATDRMDAAVPAVSEPQPT